MAKAAPKTNTTVNPSEAELAQGAGKGRPTPSRREREAANRRPLVGNSPQDKKAARARLNDERERQRIGMANGEERYLPAKDRGEQRRYVRDYVDARWGVGEALMPVMVVFVIASLFGSAVGGYLIVAVYGFVALFILDVFIVWTILKKKLAAKYGEMQRGTFFYLLSRSFQMRFLRLPKPQVKRGSYPQ